MKPILGVCLIILAVWGVIGIAAGAMEDGDYRGGFMYATVAVFVLLVVIGMVASGMYLIVG